CRAGGSVGNHRSHSSFMPAKSSSSARITVALATLSIELPADSRMAWMLVRHWRVCSWTVSPADSPVAGSTGEVPDTKIRPPALVAWLYVGGAAGASVVRITERGMGYSYSPCVTRATPHHSRPIDPG